MASKVTSRLRKKIWGGFRRARNDIETAVQYYQNGGLHTIKPEQIENRKGETRVKYNYSIPLISETKRQLSE